MGGREGGREEGSKKGIEERERRMKEVAKSVWRDGMVMMMVKMSQSTCNSCTIDAWTVFVR